eukprot:TRINITY_DN10323_c0_g1_i4.p1 TRINITY_DN10323_c0_g1~~TRINITY_DN10323_c0_g1_i4.p1  ORF type:complete len:510 (+),score=65.33 TRINITY_DN10323_c0_g1_i4:175-1704(+)
MTNTNNSITKQLGNMVRALQPNHGLSIRRYYMSADLLIRQAQDYRRDGNLEQLYVMLLRFSSLILETIPNHREFQANDSKYRSLKVVLAKDLLSEAEEVKQKINAAEARRTMISHPQGTQIDRGHEPDDFDFKDTHASQPTAVTDNLGQIIEIVNYPTNLDLMKQQQLQQQLQKQQESPAYQSKYKPRGDALQRHALTLSEPQQQSQQQKTASGGQRSLYPAFESEMPSAPSFDLLTPKADELDGLQNGRLAQQEPHLLDTPLIMQPQLGPQQVEVLYTPAPTQPPPPGATCDHAPPPPPPPPVEEKKQVIPLEAGPFSYPHEQLQQDGLRNIEISNNLIQDFLDLAIANTRKGIETCALLAGKLKTKDNVFVVNALLVPKQKGSTDQVEMLQEEEYLGEMIERDLYPLGWIHTHPTQTCFMSSIDVHTQCGRQTEMPEAVGIVMAPKDSRRKCGIFRLSTPGGLGLIQKCKLSGFHTHPPTSTGQQVYEDAGHVYLNPRIKHSYVDLR